MRFRLVPDDWRRDVVDRRAWMHPRPAQDPRVLCQNLAYIAVAAIQILWTGAPPGSVNAKAFDEATNVAYLTVLSFAAALVVASAYVRSQYTSFSLELIGCLGLSIVLLAYTVALYHTTDNAEGTQSFLWAVAFTVGNAWRFKRLVDRMRGKNPPNQLAP